MEQRTKEIGIRKVLGASVGQVVWLLSRDLLKLVLLANLVAWSLGWWAAHRCLEGFAYRIHLQWWMFALAGIAALCIALLTVGMQGIQAAMRNPINSLRTE
jgi:putative ABC transport system permease protein